jgi:hypothetical protein
VENTIENQMENREADDDHNGNHNIETQDLPPNENVRVSVPNQMVPELRRSQRVMRKPKTNIRFPAFEDEGGKCNIIVYSLV